MTEALWNELRDVVADRQAVVIVGAGASIQASGNPALGGHRVASWDGLLRHGLQRLSELGTSEDVVSAYRGLLDLGQLIPVADAVTTGLGGQGGGEFHRWLQDTVGSLRLQDRAVPDALGALGVPLLTTNYDTLLEQATGRPTLTWKEGSRWQLVNQMPHVGVLHLHGSYDRPETVVFGGGSYESVLRDEKAQNALRALASTRRLVFVGFGAGIADPNFSSLREFLKRVLKDSPYSHFRLVVDGDVERARGEHGIEERIHVLGHGGDYGSLADSLRRLAPAGVAGHGLVPPPPRPRLSLEVEISGSEVAATVPGKPPVREPLLLTSQLQVETVALLDEWLRFDHGAGRRSHSYIATVLGSILFDAVFTGEVKKLYRDQVAKATPDKPLSLVLKVQPNILTRFGGVDGVALTSIPWELLCDHDGKGCLSTSASLTFSRVYYGETEDLPWETPPQLRVLVVLAQPDALVRPVREEWDLEHTEEDKSYDDIVHEIVTTVTGAAPETPFETLGVVSTTDDVREALEKHPQIVHYIGHGRARGSSGELAFARGDSEQPDWQSFAEFVGWFDSDQPPTLVFLHLCQGARSLSTEDVGDQARGNFSPLAFELIKRQVKMVVAMQYPASADIGLTFTEQFYDSIRTGTVAEAVQAARKSVRNELPVGGLVLYLRGVDGPILPQEQPQQQLPAQATGSTPPPPRRRTPPPVTRPETAKRPRRKRADLHPEAPASTATGQRAGSPNPQGGITI